MLEFLKGYGILILIGLFFGLIIWSRVRGRGADCCGGHEHVPEKAIEGEKTGQGKQGPGCH